MEFDFEQIEGFEWDGANKDKSWRKHKVAAWESEQIFFNHPLLVLEDEKHSWHEKRWAAFGKTNADRKLVVVFTMRKRLIRVISARGMSQKERKFYEKESEKTPVI